MTTTPVTPPTLRDRQHPTIAALANCIEAAWSTHLDLEPYAMPADLGYVEGVLEGEKLVIQNQCYQTRTFRKLHLELAQIGKSLDILHCVMFPRSEFDLPIFGADLVSGRGQLAMAIADLSPVQENQQLPDAYEQALSAVPRFEFRTKRHFPEWADIFSDHCLFVRPEGEQEEQAFVGTIERYLALHCQQAQAAQPVSSDRRDQILAAQQHYCAQQLRNDKTRRVLEKAFGDAWAERYMTTVLFDIPIPVEQAVAHG